MICQKGRCPVIGQLGRCPVIGPIGNGALSLVNESCDWSNSYKDSCDWSIR